jgi:hypothetical protein
MVAILLCGFMLAPLYPLSSGPVLAYQCRHPELDIQLICRCYLPLFRAFPEWAGQYASWCGASDIEVFFLLSPVQTGRQEADRIDGNRN